METAFLDLDGGLRLRCGTWGLRPDNRARVLLLQGRSEFLEKYEEVIDHLTARGYGVVSFDWRGQGLSSRLLGNPHKGHIDSYETYLDDLDLVVSRVLRAGWDGPLVMIAHSMGAHIGLRYLIRRDNVFAAAAFIAPMWRLPLKGVAHLFAWTYSRAAVALGLGGYYAPFRRDYESARERFEDNVLTTSEPRFERAKALKIADPGLALGGPTLGWIAASLASVRALESELAAAPPALPVLVLTAEDERVVDNLAHRTAIGLMGDANQILIEGARHEILMETDALRRIALDAIEDHIARSLGTA